MSRQEIQAWRDPARPAAERVGDLISQMTLEEKAAQLASVWLGDEPRDSDVARCRASSPDAPNCWPAGRRRDRRRPRCSPIPPHM
jgi:beta-xylosidase